MIIYRSSVILLLLSVPRLKKLTADWISKVRGYVFRKTCFFGQCHHKRRVIAIRPKISQSRLSGFNVAFRRIVHINRFPVNYSECYRQGWDNRNDCIVRWNVPVNNVKCCAADIWLRISLFTFHARQVMSNAEDNCSPSTLSSLKEQCSKIIIIISKDK